MQEEEGKNKKRSIGASRPTSKLGKKIILSYGEATKGMNTLNTEVSTCAAIIAAQASGATILLAIALARQLFLNGALTLAPQVFKQF